jgi:cytochrome P450
VIDPQWEWHNSRAPYERLGVDTFLTVAPTRIICWTASPGAISQISTRWSDFPKPIDIYAVLNIYGRNVISTEGDVWRRHRKVSAPSFSKKISSLVWNETVHQVSSMLQSWKVNRGSKQFAEIEDISIFLYQLSLHVISKAGFDRSSSDELAMNGHTMSLYEAMHMLIEKLYYIILIPKFLLRK